MRETRVIPELTFPVPMLDHVVIDVRDKMDEAVLTGRSLGFRLTDRGHHTLGSINHLAVFEDDYAELLGFDAEAQSPRPDILRFPLGLNGLVFATDSADALFHDLRTHDLPVDEVIAFSRRVKLPEGFRDAEFRVVRFRDEFFPFGRVYFCQHLTRHLVWRPEWRQHPNGARGVTRITIVVHDPAASANILARVFGPNALKPESSGGWTLFCGTSRVELISPEEAAGRFPVAMPDPAARADYVAALSLRTSSLSMAERALKAGHVRRIRVEPKRILVPATEAINVALEFVE